MKALDMDATELFKDFEAFHGSTGQGEAEEAEEAEDTEAEDGDVEDEDGDGDGTTDDESGEAEGGETGEGAEGDGTGTAGDEGDGVASADSTIVAQKLAELAITWSVSDSELGEIDENGLFTATATGKLKVIAEADGLKGQSNVSVVEESDDGKGKPDDSGDDETDGESVTNEIAFYRMLPNGNITKHGSPIEEGGTKNLSGLPNPLNILNGTKIFIPEGALNENITITTKLPPFAKADSGDDTEFEGEIVNAITFEVTVDGEVVSPYYFDEPLEVSIPFKTGKMEKLGLSAEDLGMYFASDSGDIEGGSGITDIEIDDASGRITGKVVHFSTIVIAPKKASSSVNSDSDEDGDSDDTDDTDSSGDSSETDDGTSSSDSDESDSSDGESNNDSDSTDTDTGGVEGSVDGVDSVEGGDAEKEDVDDSDVDDSDVDEDVEDDDADDEKTDGEEDGDDAEDDGEEVEGPELKVFPKKVLVEIGETVKFESEIEYEDDDDADAEDDDEDADADAEGDTEDDGDIESDGLAKAAVDTKTVWSVSDPAMGVIDEDGLFTALALGKVIITATTDSLKGTARVEVSEDGPRIAPDVNTISMFRELPNGNVTKYGSRNSESDTITLGGLPFPLNVLNGTKMTIPENALSEDIDLSVIIPKFARVKDVEEDVEFDGGILVGAKFEVKVDGEVISPYYFDEPLEVVIPIKRGLMDKLGLTPEDLTMFFANEDGEIDPDDPGITDIVVDEVAGVITGKVAHFSNIVVAPKTVNSTFINNSEQLVPEAIELEQNSPNPFNPTTTISYRVMKASDVTLSIYNMVGQEIRSLAVGMHEAGSYSVLWDAKDDAGASVTSGVYFYRLKSQGITETRKLMLLK